MKKFFIGNFYNSKKLNLFIDDFLKNFKGIDTKNIEIIFFNPSGQHSKFFLGGDKFSDSISSMKTKELIRYIIIFSIFGFIIGFFLSKNFIKTKFVIIISTIIGSYIGSFLSLLIHIKNFYKNKNYNNLYLNKKNLNKNGIFLLLKSVDFSSEKSIIKFIEKFKGIHLKECSDKDKRSDYEFVRNEFNLDEKLNK